MPPAQLFSEADRPTFLFGLIKVGELACRYVRGERGPPALLEIIALNGESAREGAAGQRAAVRVVRLRASHSALASSVKSTSFSVTSDAPSRVVVRRMAAGRSSSLAAVVSTSVQWSRSRAAFS